MPEVLEMVMLICFGISWPVSILKSWRMRSRKGKSLTFLCLVWIGYLAGVFCKLLSKPVTYVLAFYIINLTMVTVDFCLYWRNAKLDRVAEQAEKGIE